MKSSLNIKVGGSLIEADLKYSELKVAMKGASRKAVKTGLARIARRARQLAPRDDNPKMVDKWNDMLSGYEKKRYHKPMKKSISHSTKAEQISLFKDTYTGRVYTTNRLGSIIEFGTGLYGPFKRRIVPKKKKYMWFRYKGRLVRAKSVKGRKATPFLWPAYMQTRDQVINDMKVEYKEAVK